MIQEYVSKGLIITTFYKLLVSCIEILLLLVIS